MSASVLERIAQLDPSTKGRLEFDGGTAVWSEGGIVVEFAATSDFRVHPGDGSMQMSRTRSDGKSALHVELRTNAGRLQLLAGTPADTLEGLPEIDGRGAWIPLPELLGFVASARALDVDTAQINAIAERLERDEKKPEKNKSKKGKKGGGKGIPPLFNLNPKNEKPNLLRHFMPIVLPLALVAVIVAVSLYVGRAADEPPPDDANVPDGVEHDDVGASSCPGTLTHSTPPVVVVEAGRVQVQTRQTYTGETGVTCVMDEGVGIGDGMTDRQRALGPLDPIAVVERDACPLSGVRPRADTPLTTIWGPAFISSPAMGEMLVFGEDLDSAKISNTPLDAPSLLNEAGCGPVISENPDGLLVLEQSGPGATLYHIAPSGETRWARHLEWSPIYGEVNGPYLLVVYATLPDLYRYGVHDMRTGELLWEYSQ